MIAQSRWVTVARGAHPKRVVVHVGDNGPVWSADWQRLKRALAGVPLVVFVNVRIARNWQGQVNTRLRRTVSDWRRATIADWYGTSTPSMLVDGVHPGPTGARRFAALIARALRDPNFRGTTP